MSVAEESEADDDPVVSIAAEALRHSIPSSAAVAVISLSWRPAAAEDVGGAARVIVVVAAAATRPPASTPTARAPTRRPALPPRVHRLRVRRQPRARPS